MAQRYYISRVLGNGDGIDPYYCELRRYIQDNWPGEPHFTQQVIAPTVIMWCIIKYDLSTAAHDDVIANVTGIFSFGAQALDTTMGEIDTAKRIAIRDKLESVGFDFDWATLSTTVREVLQYVNRSIQIAEWAEVTITTISRLDLFTVVGDIPVAARQRISARMTELGLDTGWITLATTVEAVVDYILYSAVDTPRLFGSVNPHPWLYIDEETQ